MKSSKCSLILVVMGFGLVLGSSSFAQTSPDTGWGGAAHRLPVAD